MTTASKVRLLDQPGHPLTSIEEAAGIIRKGGLVAFPTETVYGLGADATNEQAVAKIFEAKNRPLFDPLIVHVASFEQALALWERCPDIAHKLMQAFWPGPLTLVLPKTGKIPDLVTAGLPRVAIRMPNHKAALSLIRLAGCPIAAPSANRFGRISPTTAEAVEEDLGERVDMILDGGSPQVGIESTVLAFENDEVVLLRAGGVPVETIQKVLGRRPLSRPATQKLLSPGMLPHHYAPQTPLFLLDSLPVSPSGAPSDSSIEQEMNNLRLVRGKVGLMSLSQFSSFHDFSHVEVLSRSGDMVEAAARFFGSLRKLDGAGLVAIVAVPMPRKGLGLAMMDRLERASVGRAVFMNSDLYLARYEGKNEKKKGN